MNRYDRHFRMLPAHLRSVPVQKAGYASGALFEHRAKGFGPDDDEAIVSQFDLSGMAEFWSIRLAEPMPCVDFVRSLALYFYKLNWRPGLSEVEQKKLGPAAERVNDSVKIGIRQALRAARSYGEPWFIVIPDPPPSNKLDPKAWIRFVPSGTVFVHPDPPIDGIDLSKLLVQPRPAVEWMLSSARRRHLVPPSLAAAMASKGDGATPVKIVAQAVGRPAGTGLDVLDSPFVERILSMIRNGEAPSVAAAAQAVVGNGSGIPGGGEAKSKADRLRRKASTALKLGE